MLQSLEATIDRSGNVVLLETIQLPTDQKAIVVVLPDKIGRSGRKRRSKTGKIEVHFLHPRYPKTFTALTHPECTGQQALNGLLVGDKTGPFLDNTPAGRPYELVVASTQRILKPTMTFAEAGVTQGDTIEVRQAGQGAGIDYPEVAQLILTSGLSLAFLRAVASVIAQLIESREKTLEFENNGKKYKLTASSSVRQMIEIVKALKEDDSLSETVFSRQITPSKRSDLQVASKTRALSSPKNHPASHTSEGARSKKSTQKQSNVKQRRSRN
jgi:hypothetical protein